MAHAIKTTIKPAGIYVLGLTEREAQVLKRICDNVCGSQNKSARAHTRSIQMALLDAGLENEDFGLPYGKIGHIDLSCIEP